MLSSPVPLLSLPLPLTHSTPLPSSSTLHSSPLLSSLSLPLSHSLSLLKCHLTSQQQRWGERGLTLDRTVRSTHKITQLSLSPLFSPFHSSLLSSSFFSPLPFLLSPHLLPPPSPLPPPLSFPSPSIILTGRDVSVSVLDKVLRELAGNGCQPWLATI